MDSGFLHQRKEQIDSVLSRLLKIGQCLCCSPENMASSNGIFREIFLGQILFRSIKDLKFCKVVPIIYKCKAKSNCKTAIAEKRPHTDISEVKKAGNIYIYLRSSQASALNECKLFSVASKTDFRSSQHFMRQKH